jgi:hypothetical protein
MNCEYYDNINYNLFEIIFDNNIDGLEQCIYNKDNRTFIFIDKNNQKIIYSIMLIDNDYNVNDIIKEIKETLKKYNIKCNLSFNNFSFDKLKYNLTEDDLLFTKDYDEGKFYELYIEDCDLDQLNK